MLLRLEPITAQERVQLSQPRAKRLKQRRRRRLVATLLVVAGVALAATGAYGLADTEPDVPLASDIGFTPEPEPLGQPTTLTSTSPPIEIHEPAPALPDPADPARVIIDAIDVDHPIVPVGLNDTGGMEVPDNVNEIGWYEPGIRPGEDGITTLAGHVDSREQGPGAFFDLRLLEPGDLVTIIDADGIERSWEVTDVVRFPKGDVPMDTLFDWEGDTPGLVLGTCGGAFDQTSGSYEDNIVVYTTPLF